MNEVACASCGSTQSGGAAYCALCGQRFPRAGYSDSSMTTDPAYPAAQRGGHAMTAPAVAGLQAVPYAGVGRRFLAYLVDAGIGGVLIGGIYAAGVLVAGTGLTAGLPTTTRTEDADAAAALLPFLVAAGLVALLYLVGLCFWEGRSGKTVGNLALGIRTLDATDRLPIGFGRAALRWLVVGAGALACFVGQVVVVISGRFDAGGRDQGWHDKAAHAVVLDVRSGAAAARDGFAAPVPLYPAPAAPSVQYGAVAPAWGPPGSTQDVPAFAAPAPVPGPPSETAEGDAPPISGRDVVDAPAPAVTVQLELESGERHRIDGPVLLGRNPQAPWPAGWTLIAVEDPTRSVSKTHLELGVDSDGLWVSDRGSTNGTIVSVPGAPPRVAEKGARVRVPVGSTIHVGDRRLTVHPGDA